MIATQAAQATEASLPAKKAARIVVLKELMMDVDEADAVEVVHDSTATAMPLEGKRTQRLQTNGNFANRARSAIPRSKPIMDGVL